MSWHLLDRAIKQTASSEFVPRYEHLKRKKDVVLKIVKALESLDRLSSGNMPDYNNPWTAIFYLTWYQPRHINLVYSHLKSTNARLPQTLDVVDFGCGSLATMFALAVFAATSGQQEARISVHGIDSSREMGTLGLQLWERFSKVIRTEARSSGRSSSILGRMHRVLETMSKESRPPVASVDEYVQWRRTVDRDRTRHSTWLTSVHAAYHLPTAMRKTTLELTPQAMLMTADHSRKADLDRALLNLDGTQYSFRPASVEPECDGCLMHTTTWRKELRESITRKWGRFERDKFLEREVHWNPWDPNKRPIVRQAGRFR